MIPLYDELPLVPGLGIPHAWDVLDRNTGSVSLIGSDQVRAAAGTVTEGEVVSLNLSLGLIDPPLFGRNPFRHKVIPVGRNANEDQLDEYNPQSSSQWDGLRHIRAREHGFFGGVTDIADDDTETLSVEHWARSGIVGRGVLLDVAAFLAAQGRALDPFAGDEIPAADLEATRRAQGVQLRHGDILCVRTGWVSAYRELDADGQADPLLSKRFSGLRADSETARFFWDNHVAAIGADNPAIEPAPGDPTVGYLHWRLQPTLGMAVAELLDLDRLARRCAELSRWEFLFVAVPLPIPGGVSSPSNAVAIL
ncbi:cyclase family protein [Actinokineospora sp.]|uniref:cyclase family protein n=1 Tax=Actinokineospora sp. TaxID=1872133 RepID=UPI003D6C0F4E